MEQGPQPPKIFDELASIRMIQNDLAGYGYVRPETRQQIQNEELTFVAEGLNAPLETRFTLRMTSEGLVNERGDLLRQSLGRGEQAARHAANADPALQFNLKRTIHEKHEGDLVEQMMAGALGCNTMVSVSPFPEEAFRKYGKDKLEKLGYQTTRYLSFIRIYNKISETELEVVSISIDNSDLAAYTDVLAANGIVVPPTAESNDFLGYQLQYNLNEHDQQLLPANLRRQYDEAMFRRYGSPTIAGRPIDNEVEAWTFLSKQDGLIDYYMNQLENLAIANPSIRAKRELTYSFWATLKGRLKNFIPGQPSKHHSYQNHDQTNKDIEREMQRAFLQAAERQEKLIGCGGSIEAFATSSNLLDLSPLNAWASIMGDKPESYKFDRRMYCKVCQDPPKENDESKKMCGPCGICVYCDNKLKVKAK